MGEGDIFVDIEGDIFVDSEGDVFADSECDVLGGADLYAEASSSISRHTYASAVSNAVRSDRRVRPWLLSSPPSNPSPAPSPPALD